MKTSLNTERGWAVRITREDKTSFLASSGEGILPAVWINSQRKLAVQHKKDLRGYGFNAKVVPVVFARPEEIEEK